jgi:hypothetical protein
MLGARSVPTWALRLMRAHLNRGDYSEILVKIVRAMMLKTCIAAFIVGVSVLAE